MILTVAIPTYRRPQDLANCLKALQHQTRRADEVLVVVRDTDIETWNFLGEFPDHTLPLRTLTVELPGVVAAMNIALEAAKGEIIAFTDDDAAPHPDWLERIEAHFFADECVGSVGGRDYVYHGTQLEEGAAEVVGRVQWFGRVIGNHHLGIGEAREVDLLKGTNMSFRQSAIKTLRFDTRLRGTGAQAHYEVAFSLTLKQAGWKLIYDPKVAVDHYPGKRFDEDQRDSFGAMAKINAAHNETLVLLEHFSPAQQTVFLLWAILVGTKEFRGFVQFLRFLPNEGLLSGQKFFASVRGRWQGWQSRQQWVRTLASPNRASSHGGTE